MIGSAEHAELNLEVARRSLVLLRNDGLLPLDPETAGPETRGASAPTPTTSSAQLGDWAGDSGQVDWMPDGHPRELTETVLDGLRALAPKTWTS